MGRRPFLCTLAVALAAVVLSAALAAPPAAASEEPAEASETTTITTVLHPGWNMVGWVGPETPASDLFDEVSMLAGIYTWDSEAGGYRLLARPIVHLLDPLMLTPGQGLWLYLDGEAPFEWTREAREDSVLLELRAGRNLVAWAGRDGTPIEEATVRFGERLVRAWGWNVEAQGYRLYQPEAASNSLTELNHGDALLVEVTEDARWWQSGAAVPVVFLGEFTDERRAEIQGWVDGTQALIAERWGVMAPFTTYVGSHEAVTPTYRRVRGHDNVTTCGNYNNSVIFLVDRCINGGAHAHEYFHAVQFHLIGQPGKRVPGWMIEGPATYSLILYRGTVSTTQTGDESIQDGRRRSEATLGYYNLLPLSELEAYSATVKPGNFGFTLGFLAVAWLAERVGAQSIVDFFVRLADEPSWQEAFEATFGLTVEDFYEQFEAYRAEAIIPLPHLTDDSDGPALVFVGEVPAETAQAVRGDFDHLRAFFRDRLGAGTAEYSILAAAESESVAAAHLRAFGEEPSDGFCDRSSNSGLAVVVNLDCRTTAPRELDAAHFRNVRRELAPWALRPRMPAGFADYGPFWLDSAAETYVTYVYRTAAGVEGAEDIRNRAVSSARPVTRPLSSTENGWDLGRDYSGARGLGFVALELLAERAGDAALFEYYRRLPDSDSWDEAFEGAFGMSVRTFYSVFEEHRLKVWPPFPHETDDRDEPRLVFLGGVGADDEAAVRAELDAVRQRFRQLGAGPADYTVYVGADREALADIYVRVAGKQPPDSLCTWNSGQGVTIINLDCPSGSAPHLLDVYHLIAVRDRLAPAASLPPAPAGFDERGPAWLREGVDRYMRHWYRVWRGYEDPDAGRNRASSGAGQTPRLLSASATSAGFHEEYWPSGSLAFLALEWLAARAGESAILDYYRLLPGSRTWEEAFEGAFGLTIDDFYEAFEAHRARVAPPFPHLVDDRAEPVLSFVGDVMPEAEAAVRAEFESVQRFFGERFDAGPADYTVYVGADRESLVAPHVRLYGTEPGDHLCARSMYEFVALINLDCRHAPPYGLDRAHFVGVRDQLAPPDSLPPLAPGFRDRGPAWLTEAARTYAQHAYRGVRGHHDLAAIRATEVSRATRITRPLSSMETNAGFFGDEYWEAMAIGYLAVESLLGRAGEPALFEYYRLLPGSNSWEEAFEAAFGIAVTEFYEEFEAYRAEVAPPNEVADSS